MDLSDLRTGKPMRLVYVWQNLGPYHWARMDALGRAAGVALEVVQVFRRERIRAWSGRPDRPVDVRCTTLFDTDERSRLRDVVVARAVTRAVLAADPAVVLWGTGLYQAWVVAAVLAVRARGVPSVGHFVSTAADARPRGLWRTAAKAAVHRLYAGFTPVGLRQLDFLLANGVAPDRCRIVGNPVDNGWFAGGTDAEAASTLGVLDAPLRPGRFFLSVGRFSAEKNLPRLIAAYEEYRAIAAATSAWDLAVVGDGPDRESIARRFRGSAYAASIHRLPFLEGLPLRALYRSCGAFVLPSLSEPWGLVANEAAAAGCPLLLSDRCGCLPHLLHEGINGFRFDPTDVPEMARVMGRVADPRADRTAMGEASRHLVADVSPETYAERTAGACRTFLEGWRHA